MNKTIKIIDLLNKIANGEEISHFEYDDIECYLGADGYLKDNYGENVEWWIDKNWLNKEVEIIEDNDKLEKIEKEELFTIDESMTKSSLVAWQKANNGIFKKQIDFLIDHINKIEEKLDE